MKNKERLYIMKRNKSITIRLPEELYDILKLSAKTCGGTVNGLIVYMINKMISIENLPDKRG